jgi:hypothetical protein
LPALEVEVVDDVASVVALLLESEPVEAKSEGGAIIQVLDSSSP